MSRGATVAALGEPWKHGAMLTILTALAAVSMQPNAAAKPPTLGRTAWVFSTVGQSEWCPAGNVMLDLVTGRYSLTRRASRRVCSDRGLERPVKKGRLPGTQLAEVRAAYQGALAEGLESHACRYGEPHDIVLSNGGARVLVVVDGYAARSAPDDLSCWSTSANALFALMDHMFAPEDHPPPR